VYYVYAINPLNAELNSICHLLALLGAHHILHVSRIRVNMSSKIFFLADVLFLWVILDLDKYIFPLQMCFICGVIVD